MHSTDKALTLNLIIIKKNNKPAIELRKIILDPDLIKVIIDNAYKDLPIIVYPILKNKITAINTLIEKKIIKRLDDNSYEYLI